MSVFGGDSWAREAQYRKRRVDDLLLDAVSGEASSSSFSSSSSYRKLRSGKYACLVCPHNPVLDTPLMVSMHIKASRHRAAELRLKQREQERQNEINKRLALSQDSACNTRTGSTASNQTRLAIKPLIEQTRKVVSEVFHDRSPRPSNGIEIREVDGVIPANAPNDYSNWASSVKVEASSNDTVQPPLDYLERREKELKFTAAGWKRDCHGGWFRDENVEFDSDEEDPNVCLA